MGDCSKISQRFFSSCFQGLNRCRSTGVSFLEDAGAQFESVALGSRFSKFGIYALGRFHGGPRTVCPAERFDIQMMCRVGWELSCAFASGDFKLARNCERQILTSEQLWTTVRHSGMPKMRTLYINQKSNMSRRSRIKERAAGRNRDSTLQNLRRLIDSA